MPYRPKRRNQTTHPCPAGCGRTVPNRQLACPDDWARLPKVLQDAVYDTASKTLLDPARMTALTAAKDWYAQNPLPQKAGR